MLIQANSGPLKGMVPRVTVISIVVMAVALFVGTVYSEASATALEEVRALLDPMLEWYYAVLVAFMLLFMIWIGVGRYKNVRLGEDCELPEFTFFSWITMLFAAGTGIGIIFWAVAQPIMQFQDNPFVVEGLTPEAAAVAMRLSFFHWGLNAWAIFSFVAMVLAYFSFRRGLPLTVRSALHPMLGDRIYGPIGDVVDVLAVFGTIFGIATTLGLGVQQMNAGLSHVFGLPSSVELQLAVVGGLMLVATISVVSGVNRGVRMLSEANFWLSLAVAIFVLSFGPTQYLIGATVEAMGQYLQTLLGMAFYTHANHDTDWQAEWTVFFWGWTIAWSPFVGMFIARVSYGRTVREFLTAVLIVPVVVSTIWMSAFGGTGVDQAREGVGALADGISDSSLALFQMLQELPMTEITSFLAIVLVLVFFITSSDSGSLVIDSITSGGKTDAPTAQRVFWVLAESAIAAVLLAVGGAAALNALQAGAVSTGLPFAFVLVLMCVSLIKGLHHERQLLRLQGQAD